MKCIIVLFVVIRQSHKTSLYKSFARYPLLLKCSLCLSTASILSTTLLCFSTVPIIDFYLYSAIVFASFKNLIPSLSKFSSLAFSIQVIFFKYAWCLSFLWNLPEHVEKWKYCFSLKEANNKEETNSYCQISLLSLPERFCRIW